METKRFLELFKLRTDNNLEPRFPIEIGGTIFYPGNAFRYIGDLDFFEFSDCSFGVTKESETYAMKEVYKPDYEEA